MNLKIQQIHPDAKLPEYGSAGAAAFDIRCYLPADQRDQGVTLEHGQPMTLGTGLAFEIPPGHGMFLLSRSGQAFNFNVRLANSVGLIDADFRGEVMVKLTKDYTSEECEPVTIFHGERVAQAVVLPVPRCEFTAASDLSQTERGANGFGSTGGFGIYRDTPPCKDCTSCGECSAA